MILEVKKFLIQKKYAGNFDFEYLPEDDKCLIPLCKIAGAVKVFGEYEIFEDDAVSVKFTVRYKLVGQCSYCLDDAEKEVEFTSDVLFVPEKDDENYYYDGIKLNLKSAVDDAILISQPNILLCKEGCTGIDVTEKDKRGV